MKAIDLLASGLGTVAVARKLGVSAGAVSQWHKKYQQGGRESLQAKPHPGCTPKLTAKQLAKLEKQLRRGPHKHGYPTELWTLQRVSELIHKQFKVRYDPSGVWHVLRRMGWSCQKPERVAREHTPAALPNLLHRTSASRPAPHF